MLKKEVREMVKYLISERKSFKVVFANNTAEIVEYKGYCWVMGNKAYTDEELVEKMVRFQNNERKFILKFEEVEEVEEVEESIEESLVEEVENLTDDLFQESDIAYAEEAIERETNKEECNKMKTNIELRIDVDMEVIEETGYSIEEIKAVTLRTPFTNFTINDYTIVTLDNKEQIRLLPYFTAFNTMVISVSYW